MGTQRIQAGSVTVDFRLVAGYCRTTPEADALRVFIFGPCFEFPTPRGTPMPKRSFALFLLAVSVTAGFAQEGWKRHQPKVTPQTSNTTQLLIAVSPVNSQVVWAAGTGGTYVVTTDGGNTWRAGVVPGTDQLQFRSVYGVSDKIAYLMSIGNDADQFRIYKTTDGGETWDLQFKNEAAGAFYDCFAFWTPDNGIAHSDSYHQQFPDLRTTD